MKLGTKEDCKFIRMSSEDQVGKFTIRVARRWISSIRRAASRVWDDIERLIASFFRWYFFR